jgi:oligopeptidase B
MERIITVSILLTTSALAADAVPPTAKRVNHTEVRHGATVTDPYFWLREKSNPEVREYLDAENAYAAEQTKALKPFEDKLYAEMLGRTKQTDLSVPSRRAGYWYYSRTQEGKQYPILCRRKGSMDAAEEVYLDLNELAKGEKFFSIGASAMSDDQNLLAYASDTTGFRQYRLSIKNLKTGETVNGLMERVTSVAWGADNQTLLLTTEDAVTKRSNQLWRLAYGASAPPSLVYEEKDELYEIALRKTRDHKFLTLFIGSTDTSEVRYLAADRPSDPLKVFLPREKKHRYYVDHREGLFYIRTNRNGAKNFEVVTAPANDPSTKNWKTFIAHNPDAKLQGFDLFKDFGVAVEKAEAVTRLRAIEFKTGKWKAFAFPEPVYAASPAGNEEYDTGVYRYSYQSMITPSGVFEYNFATGATQLLKQQEVLGGYDSRLYASERVWVTARDGVKVPVSVVYKKGLRRDGNAPMFLTGYGSYGIGTPATFSIPRLSLLDRGMSFAIAHIRGGDEMGEKWHDDGMLMKKKNTFFDFIDCAEALIQGGWTSSERLAIEGGSAGGLLMGAVVNLRPDLFRAVHSAVPFVDVMNSMMDASLPLTVGEYLEWGNPNEKPAYDYMKTYSPYDNLEKRAYPAMLVTTSFNDSQVMYWEPAKYVARLRTLKTDRNALLLKTNMGGGHGGSSGRYDRMRETAFHYAWLMSQVGITE